MSAKENPGYVSGVYSGQRRDDPTKSSGFSIMIPSLSLHKGGGPIKVLYLLTYCK